VPVTVKDRKENLIQVISLGADSRSNAKIGGLDRAKFGS
jgi:hypothetical protein